jgi:hypothetical protein
MGYARGQLLEPPLPAAEQGFHQLSHSFRKEKINKGFPGGIRGAYNSSPCKHLDG